MDISKRQHKAERRSSDIISTLPQTILETILCLLPTREAARTSILSRDWRDKWTKIPKLEFWLSDLSKRKTEERQMQGESMDEACKPFCFLPQILLSHQGPIHELTLYLDLRYDYFELDRIVLHLSKNHTIKKLKLSGFDGSTWNDTLPISVFSLYHLTDLDLSYFMIDDQLVFSGLNNLRSLSLNDIEFYSESLLHLLSNCPSLKSLTLFMVDADCTIMQLFECLPMIEHLTVCDFVLEWLVVDSVQHDLPTLLLHLKYFCFESTFYTGSHILESFLLVLIKCSPNLEKMKLVIEEDCGCDDECTVVWEDYSDVGLEHLNELEIENFINTKHGMEFVKFVLARSPKLKKVSILGIYDQNREAEILKTLLQAPRKSNCQIKVAARKQLG